DAGGALLGVVHRDVSPHNILVGLDGVARLTDFGIAKIATMEVEATATDVLKGKVGYLPPEYLETKDFTPRSDLFSLAVVGWEALARQRLYKGATTLETIRRIADTTSPLLGTIRPDLAVLEDVIASALSRSPEHRPESVETFAITLEERARAGGGVASHAEVRAFMEKFVGAQIAERRHLLEQAPAKAIADVEGKGGSARDDAVTVSFDVLGAAAAAAPAPEHEAPEPSSRPAARPRIAGILALIVAAGGALVLAVVSSAAKDDTVERPSSGTTPSEAIAVAVDPAPSSMVASSPLSATDAASPSPPRALSPGRSRPGHAPTGKSLVPQHAPPNPYGK
ncbi:MAG: protein kinase, partial [Polyangiaceae bacterium]